MLKRLKVWQLTVAVAITAAVLLAVRVLVDAVDDQQRHSEQRRCEGNLKQLAMGVHNYASASGDVFPSPALDNPSLDDSKRLSWLIKPWPYIDQLQWTMEPMLPWDDPLNRKTVARFWSIENPDTYRTYVQFAPLACPRSSAARNTTVSPGYTTYVGIGGLGVDAPSLPLKDPRAGVFGYHRVTRVADVTDGLSNTMSIAETNETLGSWTANGPSTIRGVDMTRKPYIGRKRQFGGLHGDGAYMAFLDGSVRWVQASTMPRIVEAMATIAGREQLSPGE